MKEAIGNTYVLYFIISFLLIFILVFAGTTAYSKAFKVKNKIIDVIEYYDGAVESGGRLYNAIQSEITQKLGIIGYRIDPNTTSCPNTDGRFSNGTLLAKTNDGYRYCIYKFNDRRGRHYAVVAYAYLEIPIIGSKLDLPVYGETRTFLDI